jgi:hypothetical protein
LIAVARMTATRAKQSPPIAENNRRVGWMRTFDLALARQNPSEEGMARDTVHHIFGG